MKKLYSLYFIIFCFLSVKAYQPAEYGIFSNSLDNLSGDKKTSLSSEVNSIEVFSVKKFLDLSTNSNLPIIINCHSKDDKQMFLYREVSKKFKNKFLFISIDKDKKDQLTQLFLLILKMAGRLALPPKLDFPIIVYCEPNSILYKDGLIYFKKSSFKELFYGNFSKKELHNKFDQLSKSF